jgi:hypothetical protein
MTGRPFWAPGSAVLANRPKLIHSSVSVWEGGVRWDISSVVLVRGGVRQQYVDLPNTGIPGFTTFKLDIGFKF